MRCTGASCRDCGDFHGGCSRGGFSSENYLPGEGSDISLLDRLPEKVNGQEQALNRIFLDEMLGKLEAQERQLIYMRYYRDMTQTEIGEKMGISQVQVSRMEKRILQKLKRNMGKNKELGHWWFSVSAPCVFIRQISVI